MPPKRNISFTKPPEPAFIKRMKESIGYQEPASVDTKKQVSTYEDDEIEKDDEKPVVVVLNSSDLTEKEAEAHFEKSKKIIFSKPTKKEEEKNALDFSSKKKDIQKIIDSQGEKRKKLKNTSLLSFDEDEDY